MRDHMRSLRGLIRLLPSQAVREPVQFLTCHSSGKYHVKRDARRDRSGCLYFVRQTESSKIFHRSRVAGSSFLGERWFTVINDQAIDTSHAEIVGENHPDRAASDNYDFIALLHPDLSKICVIAGQPTKR
ncbi:hypothetical protein AGR2A_pc0141 [Agrobacterium genomosp. 2 str. CFBP 5494]|uniref:Uncharacterized protein n=1 Tax=Agrobacterium genomosp. 2 str. CFBP 5494 TaxID=1183436 RepID=A0A9W5F3F2_9HYPH|nr:hypothetical protein AGR2A_pc0141 [Agrobacterium genomosp. 2 str. CFBP 5494]